MHGSADDVEQLLDRQHRVAGPYEDDYWGMTQLELGLAAQAADAQLGQAFAAARAVHLGGVERQDRQRGAAERRHRMRVFRTLKQRGHNPVSAVLDAVRVYRKTDQLPSLPRRITENG